MRKVLTVKEIFKVMREIENEKKKNESCLVSVIWSRKLHDPNYL